VEDDSAIKSPNSSAQITLRKPPELTVPETLFVQFIPSGDVEMSALTKMSPQAQNNFKLGDQQTELPL
jgi:hypothetical protein